LISTKDEEQLKTGSSEFKLIEALLKYHPKGEKKSKGLVGLKVGKPPKSETRCFFMIKDGGVQEDFSYMKCLSRIEANPPYEKKEGIAAAGRKERATCKFYLQGRCKNGANCKFSHVVSTADGAENEQRPKLSEAELTVRIRVTPEEEVLRKLAQQCGGVASIEIHRWDEDGDKGRPNRVLVTFKSQEGVDAAMKLHGSSHADCKVDVTVLDGSKGKDAKKKKENPEKAVEEKTSKKKSKSKVCFICKSTDHLAADCTSAKKKSSTASKKDDSSEGAPKKKVPPSTSSKPAPSPKSITPALPLLASLGKASAAMVDDSDSDS